MARKRRRKRTRAAASAEATALVEAVKTSLASTVAASNVVELNARTPSIGRRTAKPSISRWDRASTQYREIRFPELINFIRAAERGRIEDWADLTRRMLKSDTDLVSVIDSRIDPVASAPYEVAAGGSDALAHAAADATEWMMKPLDVSQIIRDAEDAVGMGFSVGEIIWGRRDGWWVPVEIIPIHPRRFAFTDSFELVLRVDYADEGLEGERVMTRSGPAVRLPPDKYLVHQPRQILDYPTSSGLFITTARFWWIKQQIWKYWLGGAEQQANPRWHGTYNQQANKAAKDELFEALEDLAADGVLATSDAVTVTDISGDFTSGADIWDRLLTKVDAAYAKLWLGSTLNVEVGEGGGNRALGESQAEQTIEPRRARDARSFWGSWQRCVVDPFLRFNAHPIGAHFQRVPSMPQLSSVFEVEQEVVDQPAIDAGVVTADELRRSRGLPEWGGERGERIVSGPARPAFTDAAEQPTALDDEPATEVATPDPFGMTPWEMASRILSDRSPGATATSTPSTTTPSDSER